VISFHIRVMNSRRMRSAGHVARIGDRRVACRVLVGRSEANKRFENLGIDWRIILKWIVEKWDGGHGLD
jgi:hypothetical protein